MWTAISLLWKTNKKLVIYVVGIAFVMLGLWYSWYQVTTTYYNKGITYQQGVYNKQQADLKIQRDIAQKEKDKAMFELNNELSTLKNQYAQLQLSQSKEAGIQEEKINEYKKSNSGTKQSLDSQWLQLYQDSLPN